jgi:diguanylate cyclase (GGDEF)-like protein
MIWIFEPRMCAIAKALRLTVLSLLICGPIAFAEQDLLALERAVQQARVAGDPREEGDALFRLGSHFAELSQLEKAITAFTRAYDLATTSGDDETRLNALNSLANVYYNAGQLEAAQRYYQTLVELDTARGDQAALATSLFNLGHVYASLQEFEQSDESFDKALDLSRKLDDLEGEAFALKALGVSAHAQSELTAANARLQDAASLFLQIGDAQQAAVVYRHLGDIELDAENFERAIAYYTEALPYLEDNSARRPLMRMYRGLAQAYSGVADYERAFIAHQAYTILLEEDLRNQSEETINRLQVEFETARLADDNTRLALENEKQELQIAFSNQRARLQYLALGLAALVLALVILFWQRSRQHAARMAELATTDGLTGLLNRRAIYELGQQEWDRSLRFKRPLTVMIFDIDHFKSINDGYGHGVGDAVLTVVANKGKSAVRKTDRIGRIGGEEFLVICSETDADQAAVVAERIRTAIEAEAFDEMPERQVTISMGVAQRAEDADLETLIARADEALYEAKESGRNRVVIR